MDLPINCGDKVIQIIIQPSRPSLVEQSKTSKAEKEMAAFYKLAILVLLVSLGATANARKRSPNKPPAVPPMVFGTIFCDRCMDKTFSFTTIAIPNVTAIIQCGDFQASNTTSEFGVFTIALPAEVASSPAKLASCSVKVASDFSRVEGDLGTCNTPVKFQFQPWSPPSPPSMPAFQSSLKIARPWPFYSAGPFFFQPPEPLPSCNENPFRHSKPAVADDQGSSAAPPPHPAFPGFGNFPPFFPGAIPPTANKVAPPPHPAFPGFGSFPPFFPGAFPPVDHSTASKVAPPPHSAFPGLGWNFPPFVPGAFPPVDHSTAFKVAPPPHPGFGYPLKPAPHGSNKAAPPPFANSPPSFPGAFPPHPSSSKPGSAPPTHGSHSTQAPPPFHGTKKHHHP
ncbi:hypothetical protein SELMODRAFT_448128 [Selaginella moellendorffii]|uniref:Uncharacterized protein n=1 Tax=Selaginella moellendorffii TaxID=88036 RepID=D8T4Z1_SELML|nr:hypothetical protein SELMODRAFT_448128 [Selaginella moellendorffii]